MPILDPDDTTAPAAPPPIQIASPNFKSVTNDTDVVEVAQLLTQIEGAPWTVRYFSRVLGSDDSVGGQGQSTPPEQQQYREIRNLEIRVQQDLTASQDSQTSIMTYQGVSLMFPYVIPNSGDMFVAAVGDGRDAIFQVTHSEKRSIFRSSAHQIDYKMIDFVHSVDDTRLADLVSKVVTKFEFVRDFIKYGQNPLLFESEYDDLQYLRRNYKSILTTYLKSYYSREYDTMVLPGQTAATYDPYLMKALFSFFETTDGEQMYKARQLNVDDDQASRATSIWDALLNRDVRLMADAFTQVGTCETTTYSPEALYDGIRFSGIVRVVYPVDATLTVDYNIIPTPKLVSGTAIALGPQNLSMAQFLAERNPVIADGLEDPPAPAPSPAPSPSPAPPPPGPIIPPVINRALVDGYYVLSKAFYERDQTPGSMSQLELMVWAYLDDQRASFQSLRGMCAATSTWTALDKFYLIPILLVMIRAALRGI